MSVFKIVSGNACHYIRAASAANARVRAYKVWGMQGATVQDSGPHSPDIGRAGYDTACRTLDAYKAPQQAPQQARTVTRKESATVSSKAQALAKLLGLAI